MVHPREQRTRPLKVFFYQFFPGGGIGRYTHELLSAMGALPDVEAVVVCSPDYQWRDTEAYACWPGLGVLTHPLPPLRRLRFLKGQFVNPRRCIDYALDHGADVVHFSNINHLTFPYWRRSLEASGLRVAVTAHDVRRQKSILSRSWEDRQLKAFYRFADAIFVHSTYQAGELVDFAGVARHKIHVVPHGPYPHGSTLVDRDAERTRLGIPTDRQVALFFGQIRDEKNLDGFIRAMSLAEERLHLVVAGQGGGRHRDVASYQALARQAGVEERITFIDRYIPDEEVGSLFGMADWIVLPYSNHFTSQSGVLNVAAHYERPVLVSSAPVLSETVQECDIGVACTDDSAAALAAGIHLLCGRIRAGYSHQFDAYRCRYSWQENARRTIDVYKSLFD